MIGAASGLPSLPLPRLHIHKGLGENFDLGLSGFWLTGNYLIGGDLKFVLIEGEEGLTWAFRFCYAYNKVTVESINAVTKTYAPQILVSRKMEFADPYLGLGVAYAMGSVEADFTEQIAAEIPAGFPVPDIGKFEKTARAYGGQLFGGVSLKVPNSGLRLTIEMSYNTVGTSTLGVKAGFTF